MKKLLFIHRSVGENAIVQGDLYGKLTSFTAVLEFSDFNQNTSVYRNSKGSKTTILKMPGENTRPEDYAELFSEKPSKMLDFVLHFDVIIIKSCYPNSNIKSQSELEQVKAYYRSICSYISGKPSKKLIILTSPPLQPLMTSKINAKRAQDLAEWLTTEKFGDTIKVFNLHKLLADYSGLLGRKYRRLFPFDSHPNKKANELIAQELTKLISQI